MCIAVFMWEYHPLYPFLLFLNRDEYHNRSTEPLGWWEGGEILGGRDGQAGGTWLASSRDGRLAFITNIRELQSIPQAKSRGHLPVSFLQAQRLDHNFKEVLARYGKDELPLAETVSELMMDTTKDDLSVLPEYEYHSSAIYIDVSRPQGRYGTRNQSALSVKSNGEVCFYERYLDNDLWKERTVTYQIEMRKEIIGFNSAIYTNITNEEVKEQNSPTKGN
ncbi:hypothetical protein REPUB_Repub04eG0104700 [Reevesia pubescens]